MLYDFSMLIFALAMCGMAVLCVRCYRLGLRDGMGAKEGKMPEPVRSMGRATVKKADKYDDILANIDAYDGTGKGQRAIK